MAVQVIDDQIQRLQYFIAAFSEVESIFTSIGTCRRTTFAADSSDHFPHQFDFFAAVVGGFREHQRQGKEATFVELVVFELEIS